MEKQKVMVDKSKLSFPVMFQKLDNYSNEDGRFTKVKVWLMHLEKNENGSIFKKEVVDDALSTLAYIPIVGFIEKNNAGEKDFSDHRYIITKDEKGVRRKYVGSAYGVVLSSDENNAHYEDRVCDDGETRTFLVVDGVIWNMFEDSSDIMNRDLIKSHSMELYQDAVDAYEGYEDEDGNFVFTKFSFRAACILGNDSKYQPAMTGSTIEVQFTVSDFVKDIQSELNDKYTTFTKLVNEKIKQGGKETMPNTDFTQTVMEQISDISGMVSQYETMRDRWGDNVPRFCFVDIQNNEVIVTDKKDNFHYYGFLFTMNGDKPEIDFKHGKRKKTCFEDYEDGTNTASDGVFDFGTYISEIEETAFSKISEAETAKKTAEENYTSIKAEYDKIKPEYEEYVRAEQKRLDDELDAKKDAMFAQFENVLSDNADFKSLKDNKGNFTVDEIEAKCSILFSRKNISNFSKSTDRSAKVGVMNDSDGDSGYVSTIYGNIPVENKK